MDSKQTNKFKKKNKKKFNRKLKFNIATKFCRKFCSTGFCPNGTNCSFVHDITKIAICQRCIYGQCKTPRCLLSHEKTPDRMPDCSFFLKGCCNVENCLFRHVKVNRNANLCKKFLKGLCFNGLNCRQMHQFECRAFKRTGKCKKGNKCNFSHHNGNNSAKCPDFKKFKKINKTNNSDDKSEETQNTSKIPNKSILNELLAKRLQSPVKTIMVPAKMKMINMESPSFIKLSTDDSIYSETESSLENNRANAKNESNESNIVVDDTNNHHNSNNISNEETKKYFLIGNNDEKSIFDLININNRPTMTTTTISKENICRPPLKIIPDFLMNPTV